VTVRQQAKGFTLLEFVVSVGILAFVVLTAMRVLTEAQFMAMEARHRLSAANAARAVLETVKNTPLAALGTINTNNFVPADLPSGAIQLLTNPAALAGAQIATVTVRVTWRNPKNMPATLEISTMRWRL